MNIIEKKIKSKDYSVIIGVDGGANHLYKMGMYPNFIIGDLDSIDENVKIEFEKNGASFKVYEKKKNETDTELAIWLAEELGATEIDLYGALGRRIDHELANIFLLNYMLSRGDIPTIIDEYQEIRVVENGEVTIEGKKGDLISIISLKGDAKGVSLVDLEYDLDSGILLYSVPRGISNVMTGDTCKIGVKEGNLLVIKVSK